MVQLQYPPTAHRETQVSEQDPHQPALVERAGSLDQLHQLGPGGRWPPVRDRIESSIHVGYSQIAHRRAAAMQQGTEPGRQVVGGS